MRILLRAWKIVCKHIHNLKVAPGIPPLDLSILRILWWKSRKCKESCVTYSWWKLKAVVHFYYYFKCIFKNIVWKYDGSMFLNIFRQGGILSWLFPPSSILLQDVCDGGTAVTAGAGDGMAQRDSSTGLRTHGRRLEPTKNWLRLRRSVPESFHRWWVRT